MPRQSKREETTADVLRGFKRKDADEAAELLAGELSELKSACETVAEALGEIDTEHFDALAEALDQLPATSSLADSVRDAAAGLNMVLLEVGEAETFREFAEQYDAAEEALFAFTDLRDSDSYPGIGEERASAWEEAVACFDLLADAWEQVGEDASQATVTPPD